MGNKPSRQNNIQEINSNELSLSLKSRNECGIQFYNVENSSWIPFGDIDNEIIEETFSKNRKELELDKYLINFDRVIQIDKHDSSIERSFKGELYSSSPP